jgi:hypothetical protein
MSRTPSKRIDDVFFSHFQISVAMAGKAEVKLRPLPHVTILPAHGFLPTADRAGSGGGWDEEEMETAISTRRRWRGPVRERGREESCL